MKLTLFNYEIDSVQKDLLLIQAGIMYTYNECLKARLVRFELSEAKELSDDYGDE